MKEGRLFYMSTFGYGENWEKEYMEKNGGYDLEGVIWHQHSNKLMKKILELWPNKNIPIVDLGCGHNFYVSVLKYAGYDALGIDSVDFGSKYATTGDLTKPWTDFTTINRDIHNVISLEVGEHIPADKASVYLDNVCSFGGDVIMSWAIPGQAGVGHINCQSNEWVVNEMYKRGYLVYPIKQAHLREAVVGCHCTWFQNTLMYFTPRK